MPLLPPHPCNHRGCPEVTAERYCPAHATLHPKRFDGRASAAARGYDGRHREWRKLILHRSPVCAICGIEPAGVADHIVPLAKGGDWTLENGQGVCHPCHNWKTSMIDPLVGVEMAPIEVLRLIAEKIAKKPEVSLTSDFRLLTSDS